MHCLCRRTLRVEQHDDERRVRLERISPRQLNAIGTRERPDSANSIEVCERVAFPKIRLRLSCHSRVFLLLIMMILYRLNANVFFAHKSSCTSRIVVCFLFLFSLPCPKTTNVRSNQSAMFSPTFRHLPQETRALPSSRSAEFHVYIKVRPRLGFEKSNAPARRQSRPRQPRRHPFFRRQPIRQGIRAWR